MSKHNGNTKEVRNAHSNRESKSFSHKPFAGVKDMLAVKSIVSGVDLDTRLGRSIDTSLVEQGMRFKNGTVLAYPEPGQNRMGRGCRNPLRHGWMTPEEELAHQIKVPAGAPKGAKPCLYFTTETGAADGFLTVGPAPDDMIDPPVHVAEVVE